MRLRSWLLFVLPLLLPAASLGCGARSSLDAGFLPGASVTVDSGGPGAGNDDADAATSGDARVEPSDGAGGPDGADAAAEDGSAACEDGGTLCDGVCLVLNSSEVNCGGCGIVCSSGESCVNGLCRGIASVWPTLGGDVHHSGYNATETGTPPLTAAWSSALGVLALSPAVSDGNAVYVGAQTEIGGAAGSSVWAVSPADGQLTP